MNWDDLGRLVEYPGADLAEAARRAAESAPALAPFSAWAAATPRAAAEELYTQTFDVSAPVCLEAGWHLFGEAYRRGALLVKLRLAARAHGVEEGSELPDHLSVLLRLLARLAPDEDPRGLVEEVLLPSLAAMIAAFPPGDSPYRGLLEAIAAALAEAHALAMPSMEPERRRLPVVTEVQP